MKRGIVEKQQPEKDISVEIIIPTLNEEATIGDLLRQIKSKDLPLRISAMVIDVGSRDHTIEICKQENIKVIRQKVSVHKLDLNDVVDYKKISMDLNFSK